MFPRLPRLFSYLVKTLLLLACFIATLNSGSFTSLSVYLSMFKLKHAACHVNQKPENPLQGSLFSWWKNLYTLPLQLLELLCLIAPHIYDNLFIILRLLWSVYHTNTCESAVTIHTVIYSNESINQNH